LNLFRRTDNREPSTKNWFPDQTTGDPVTSALTVQSQTRSA